MRTVVRRRYMGESRGGSSEVSSGNAVGNELYRETAGNRGKVGGVTTVNSCVLTTVTHGSSLHRICPKLLIDSSPS